MAADVPTPRYEAYRQQADRLGRWDNRRFVPAAIEVVGALSVASGELRDDPTDAEVMAAGLHFCLEGDSANRNYTLKNESDEVHATVYELARRLAQSVGCRVVPMEVTQGGVVGGQ